ncbi:MAG TPA: FAD-dependent monooxygenase [Micromonosporaceae bacterium]|nr:FAD-dependent monooxygenase [Micromonosporaceae bacterium]
MSRRPLEDADFDVLVVGSGPTGLMAACQLLRCGVRIRIIDRAAEPLHAPKALSLWPRALDILDDLGVGEGIRQASIQVNAFSYFSNGQSLASFGFSPDLASRILPQPVTERLLTERLHAFGGKIERGVRLLGLDDVDFSGRIDDTDGVTAILENDDGRVKRVRVPFVIGADGAGSTVRGLIGSGFQGSTYEMAFALMDSRIDGHLPADRVLYYQNPTGTLVIVPAPDGVFRFLSVLPVLPKSVPTVNVPMMQAILDERGPQGVRLTEPVWQTVFRVHARHATDFQRGRVFIMGDAAHVHSPAGGQGMNNGLQDAHNLGWKLAAVIRGDSPSSLLLSYGSERAEATRRIVRDTDLQTRAWMVKGRWPVLARDAAFRLLDRSGLVSRYYAPVMAGRRLAYTPTRETQQPSQRLGCGLWHRLPGRLKVGAVFPRRLAVSHHICGPDADPLGWTVAVLPPTDSSDWLTQLDRLVARWPKARVVRLRRRDAASALNCRHPGYYLIRPDGHVAAHGHERDLKRLATELGVVLNSTDPA